MGNSSSSGREGAEQSNLIGHSFSSSKVTSLNISSLNPPQTQRSLSRSPSIISSPTERSIVPQQDGVIPNVGVTIPVRLVGSPSQSEADLLQHFNELYYKLAIPHDWRVQVLQYNNASSSSQKNQQKIFFSPFDKGYEKDFLEIYVSYTPYPIEKEAQFTIDDIVNPRSNQQGEDSNNNNQSWSGASTKINKLIEPKIVKGITPVHDKIIQPEKRALYFTVQFQHELLPNKILYKKVYFIQDTNGLSYCLMLTTTRKEPDNVIGYTLSTTPRIAGNIYSNIQQPTSPNTSLSSLNSTNSSNSGNNLNVSSSSSSTSLDGMGNNQGSQSRSPSSLTPTTTNTTVNHDQQPNLLSTSKQDSTSSPTPRKTSGGSTSPPNGTIKNVRKRLSTAFSGFSSVDTSTSEDDPFFESRMRSNSVGASSSAPQVPDSIDGPAWVDILVRELLVVRSIPELPRKTADLDDSGVVLSVPLCFIPSLKLDVGMCGCEEEIKRHFGIADLGKRGTDFKLLLYHPIQFLAKGQMVKEAMIENFFITYVKIDPANTTTSQSDVIPPTPRTQTVQNMNMLKHYTEDVASENLDITTENTGNLLDRFYDNVFMEKIKKWCTIVSSKDVMYSVETTEDSGSEVSENVSPSIQLNGKYIELETTTYGGETLKKLCCLVERKNRIWIYVYSSTNNLIAREVFDNMLSEIKYKQ